MPRSIEPARLARVRAARQLLHRPRVPSHPADIARAIGGSQAQELPAGRLAFRSRNRALTAADVDHARTEERSLVRTWVMRNTVHLVATEDLPWLRPLFAPLMSAFNRRRLGQLGIDANTQERALSLIARYLAADGPVTRTELNARLGRAGIGLDGSHRAHIFPLAVVTGVAAIGPGEGAATTLVAAADWLPEEPNLDRDGALTELARRYFAAFGPATEADFAGWAGLPLRDVRKGIEAIAAGLTEVRVAGERAWAPKGRQPSVPPELVRLLPGYDTYLMGYRDRGFMTISARWKLVAPGGGILRPTITEGGRITGLWKLRRRKGSEPEVAASPFATPSAAAIRGVDREIADVIRFET